VSDEEDLAREGEHNGLCRTCHGVRRRLVEDPLVRYPQLVYRSLRGDELVDETVLPIPMRCFSPDEVVELAVEFST